MGKGIRWRKYQVEWREKKERKEREKERGKGKREKRDKEKGRERKEDRQLRPLPAFLRSKFVWPRVKVRLLNEGYALRGNDSFSFDLFPP